MSKRGEILLLCNKNLTTNMHFYALIFKKCIEDHFTMVMTDMMQQSFARPMPRAATGQGKFHIQIKCLDEQALCCNKKKCSAEHFF